MVQVIELPAIGRQGKLHHNHKQGMYKFNRVAFRTESALIVMEPCMGQMGWPNHAGVREQKPAGPLPD